jgi:hypothetical protein
MVTQAQSNLNTPESANNVIQVTLLLDVSNSMDGLISQAKAELWSIVNEASKATRNGKSARLEIGLFEYGRSSLTLKSDYVRKLLNFTTDLDTISEVLFSLNTNGGDEYCGSVIYKSLNGLAWINDDAACKVIYIAGNEPFNQGSFDYKLSCNAASMANVIVNTIHCGDSLSGVRDLWSHGAALGKGGYFFINKDGSYEDIETPFDSLIHIYNDSLNNTYKAYGQNGYLNKSNQMQQDANAYKMGKSIAIKRAYAKSQKNSYSNTKWDVLDAYSEDTNWVSKQTDEYLPSEMKGKTIAEKKAILIKYGADRNRFSNIIGKLNIERQKYIDLKNQETRGKKERTLGSALIQSIRDQASKKGFTFAE